MIRLASIMVCLGTSSYAQSSEITPSKWEYLPGLSSADLARSEWAHRGAAGLSWPDGDQAVVSFWEAIIEGRRLTIRCFTYLGMDGAPNQEICAQAVSAEN